MSGHPSVRPIIAWLYVRFNANRAEGPAMEPAQNTGRDGASPSLLVYAHLSLDSP